MALFRVDLLAEEALAASARFHAEILPEVLECVLSHSGDHLVLVFAPADHTHRGWRLAVVQQLAREHAPFRVNAVESDDQSAISATLAYLDAAPGVTGQLLPLDGIGADRLLSSPA